MLFPEGTAFQTQRWPLGAGPSIWVFPVPGLQGQAGHRIIKLNSFNLIIGSSSSLQSLLLSARSGALVTCCGEAPQADVGAGLQQGCAAALALAVLAEQLLACLVQRGQSTRKQWEMQLLIEGKSQCHLSMSLSEM